LWEKYVPNPYKITKIVAIKNPKLQQVWERKLSALEIRSQKIAFKPLWEKEGHILTRREILNRLERFSIGKEGIITIVPGFHGTQESLVDEICETGFANLATTDPGFFGKGIYSTPQGEYAARVYGKGACILSFISVLNAFPVIFEDMPSLLGAGSYANCDVHFAPVVPKRPDQKDETVYEAIKITETPVYDELVVFQDSQIVPRFVIYYDKNKCQ